MKWATSLEISMRVFILTLHAHKIITAMGNRYKSTNSNSFSLSLWNLTDCSLSILSIIIFWKIFDHIVCKIGKEIYFY